MVYVDESKLIGFRQGQVLKKGHVPRREICEEAIAMSGAQGHDVFSKQTFSLTFEVGQTLRQIMKTCSHAWLKKGVHW